MHAVLEFLITVLTGLAVAALSPCDFQGAGGARESEVVVRKQAVSTAPAPARLQDHSLPC